MSPCPRLAQGQVFPGCRDAITPHVISAPGWSLQEASRGVLIKGHNKIDLPAHQKKCPPGK